MSKREIDIIEDVLDLRTDGKEMAEIELITGLGELEIDKIIDLSRSYNGLVAVLMVRDAEKGVETGLDDD